MGKRFLDPACGSGIFLVGLFNRLAEEWKEANPTARNDRTATELMRLLRDSLFGVDISLTACRITAFSLYLAYLDQLSPRDIQALQRRGKALPRLVASDEGGAAGEGNIRCGDFFGDRGQIPKDVSLVVGNPPWGSTADEKSPAGIWCAEHDRPLPDKQIAAALSGRRRSTSPRMAGCAWCCPTGCYSTIARRLSRSRKAWSRRTPSTGS